MGGVKLTGESLKIHLAERDPQHHSWAKNGVDKENMKLRILLSYHYYKDSDLDELFAKYFTEPYPEVFADSGGFSAMTQGVDIDINDYIGWVRRWEHLLSVYANLDVIGNPEKTAENQRTIEDAGLQPLPVFHTGSDWEFLERYIDEYQYIALGGMVPFMRFPKRIMPWLIQAFKRAEGKAVYHGFGATAWTVVQALPWYSVDSSSWGQGFRFGQVPLFDSRKGKFEKANLGDWKGCRKHAELFHRLGFDWQDFGDRARNERAKICAISALSYMKAEVHLRRRHGDVLIPSQPNEPEVLRVHLADANPQRFGDAVKGGAGPRLHLSDTSNGINFGDADKGLKLHLADARPASGGDLAAADSGLKLHLAEHSLDRGGAGGHQSSNGDYQ